MGKLTLKKVAKNVKINSDYYQRYILDPIFREEIPALYNNDIRNVFFHQDKATSHFSRSTTTFLQELSQETGINVIPKNHIPVKSPDAAPMDFCVFGILKRAIGDRHPKTLNGLWKVLCEEWEKLSLITLQKALLTWKLRCRAIVKNQGYPIEHNRRHKYGLYKN